MSIDRESRANPEVSITLDGGNDVVIVEGVVETLTPDRELAERLAAASKAKYPEYGMKAGDYERPGALAARPRVEYAWKAFPRDITRFRFEGSGLEA